MRKPMEKAKKYDMKKPEDVERWFEEMDGYLKTSRFVESGTDHEGRCFALHGLKQLRNLLCKKS